MTRYGISCSGYLGGVERFLGGTLGAVPERYRLSSSISREGPGGPPTFLAHGKLRKPSPEATRE